MKFLVVVNNNVEKKKAKFDLFFDVLKKKKIKYEIVQIEDIDDYYKNNNKIDIDMLLTLGGDGTVLSSVRLAKKFKMPLLGINVGHVGFLTSITGFDNIDFYINKVQTKKYYYENRSMINVKVLRDKKILFDDFAINEATIFTKDISKMGIYELSIDGENKIFNEYRADGIIIATPSGSTGHSLSAGGPMVAPDVKCFIITAICPHAFNQRSIIINDSNCVCINVTRANQIIDLDGRVNFDLKINDTIKISRVKDEIKFVTFEKNNFINNIKDKISNI